MSKWVGDSVSHAFIRKRTVVIGISTNFKWRSSGGLRMLQSPGGGSLLRGEAIFQGVGVRILEDTMETCWKLGGHSVITLSQNDQTLVPFPSPVPLVRTCLILVALLPSIKRWKLYVNSPNFHKSSVIRQKDKSQNRCFRKTKHANWSWR